MKISNCVTGKSVQYSGGCHGGHCAIGGEQQKAVANGSHCATGGCHGGVCDKSAEKPVPIAEGRPVHVATGMLPPDGKVPMAQPMI